MKKFNHNKVSHLLRMRREQKQLSRLELGKRLKVNQQQIYSWESGLAPLPVKHVGKLCKFLEIPQKVLIKTLVNDYRNEIVKFITRSN